MRQIGIIPSGCQVSHKETICFTDKAIIYASTLAVYVLNSVNFNIEKVLSVNERCISSISCSPHNQNLLAVAGVDGMICIWNIEEEEIQSKVNVAASGNIGLYWDPFNPNNCSISCYQATLRFFQWDTLRPSGALNEFYSSRNQLLKCNVARWSPHKNGRMAVGCNSGAVLLLDASTTTQAVCKILEVKDRTTEVVDIQWDRLSDVYLLVAYQNFVSLWDAERAEEIHTFERQPIPITSIDWLDWTAGNFISTNAKNGSVKIWNASQIQPLENIRVSSSGIIKATVDSCSKRLLLACAGGNISVFHMQKMQEEFSSEDGHTDTIFDCEMSPLCPNILASASYDGTVKLWNLPNTSLHKTLQGTAGETLYSCDWSPNAVYIVASSFVGELIIWNAETTKEVCRYSHHKKQVYCVQWNKENPSLIASTGVDHNLIVIHVDMDELEGSFQPSSAKLSSRKRGDIAQRSYTESQIRFKFAHPGPIYGCAWCLANSSIISTCCQDGNIRVFDVTRAQLPVYILVGHGARAFNCKWSPLLPNVLASGSDDQSIIIWELDLSRDIINSETYSVEVFGVNKLLGHTSYVRALSWCFELKYLLLSGSWDSSIKVWDVITKSCLMTLNGHVADVYAITSSAMRPFTFTSCSRDTTLRIWELGNAFTSVMPAVARIACFNDVIEVNIDMSFHEILRTHGGEQTQTHSKQNSNRLLTGKCSKFLNSSLQMRNLTSVDEYWYQHQPFELALRYQKIFNFICGTNGSAELWSNVIAVLRDKQGQTQGPTEGPAQQGQGPFLSKSAGNSVDKSSNDRKIFHESEILSHAKFSAIRLESSKLSSKKSGEHSAKVEQNLREAALIHAKTGNFKGYCSVMIDIGDWLAALALAPAVSLGYWKELSHQYAQHLATELSEKCIPHFAGSGYDEAAIEFYLSRKDVNSAMMIAKMSERKEEQQIIEESSSSKDWSLGESPQKSRSESMQIFEKEYTVSSSSHRQEAKKLLKFVTAVAADMQLLKGRPILAAAQLMAMGDITTAIDVLSESNEHELAFALAKVFELNDVEETQAVHVAEKCAIGGSVEIAIKILKRISDFDLEIGFLLSKFCVSIQEACSYLDKVQVKSQSWWLSRAQEEELMGSDSEAVISYVIGRQYQKAAVLGISVLKKYIREPLGITPAIRKLIRGLKYLRATEIEEPLKTHFLSYMFWFGAHEAVELGLWETASNMLRILRDKVVHGSLFPVSNADIGYQIMIFKISMGSPDSVDLLREFSESCNSSVELLEIVRALRSLVSTKRQPNVADGLKKSEFSSPSPNRPSMSSSSPSSSVSLRKKLANPNNEFAAWGSDSKSVYRELQRLGDAISLPSLAKVHKETSLTRAHRGAFAQGSFLPTSNAESKQRGLCVISRKRIRGPAVTIMKGGTAYASINEVINWTRVNSFSPAFDGEFLLFS